MTRESLILHLGRQPDKIDGVINALNRRLVAPKLEEGDKGSINALEFCYMHGYKLTDIAVHLGKKIE